MRSELDLLKEWYAYNSFVRRRYLRLFSRLRENQLIDDRGASFPSLIDIFTHVIDAYRWWFLYVYQDRIHEWKRLREMGLPLSEVKQEESKINSHVTSFLNRLGEADLDRTVTYHIWSRTRQRSKRTSSLQLRDMLWHMIEEELQHRGELNALLWQINIDPPITEWEDWQKLRSRSK